MDIMSTYSTKEREDPKRSVKLWIIVFSISLAFLLYGLFMFFAVGDKGPPDWDFGIVEDIPGKSVFSTHPEPSGSAGEPEAQHVAGKPSRTGSPAKEKHR
jgi:hypothetical protein